MNTATTFLACKKGNTPFLFLGILVGANPRSRKVWDKVINNIKSRLSSWKGRNISIGGRVTLINAVLNAVPSFTLSFYKALGMIIKEIRSLLSNFLWSSNANKRSIHWMKWETVCKPREKGGLGVRDVGEINKALLLKWKWRILKEDFAIWSGFLKLRYHEPKIKVLASYGQASNSKESKWWKDVILTMSKRIVETKDSRGVLNVLLEKAIVCLFGLLLVHGSRAMWYGIPLASWVTADVLLLGANSAIQAQWRQLWSLLQSASMVRDGIDEFLWCPNVDGSFSVASASSIISDFKEVAWMPFKVALLKVVWKSPAPLKIQFFT
ncbi:uncharacterized protein LOC131596972 [Vicia villosa]|uniref:uncharacterized protein LOC131596972 n=1 Tax=Vicia villosa TaxID=3911 RepID=UPI00273A9AE3|nr:uncharacterized protein LOC131596972 [Vicia villosa]